MLAKNSRAPRGIWFYALSFTTIASMLAPTELSDTLTPVFQYRNALHHPQKRPISSFLTIH
jgi:hypothetical protein